MAVRSTSVLLAGRPVPLLSLTVLAGLAAAAAGLPVVYLAVRAFSGGLEGALELLRPRVLEIWLKSVVLGLLVASFSTLLGLPLAWLTSRSDLPGRRLWAVLAALPLVIPSYVAAFALVAALGPSGLLRRPLQVWGWDFLPEIYGLFGAVVALTLLCFPYVFLTTRAGFLVLDSRLEEVAATLGHGPWACFRRVVLPLLRPSMAAGFLLVALYTLSDFGAVSLLQFDSFTRVIYVHYRGTFDRSGAALLSLLLVAKTVLLLVAARRLSDKGPQAAGWTPRLHRPVQLGAWKWPALLFCTLVALASLGIPVGMTLYWMAHQEASLAGAFRNTVSMASNSVFVSAVAAVLAAALAFPVAYLATRHTRTWSRLLESAVYLGYALPGIVIALALVFFGARHAGFLYQTLPLLIFAYVVRFLPQAVGSQRGALAQISPRLEEAALSLGAPPRRVMAGVILPLCRPALLSAFALVFLTVMKELPATLLLAPIGFETLATRIWTATSEGFFAEAALPALLLILLSAAFLTLLAPEGPRLTWGVRNTT